MMFTSGRGGGFTADLQRREIGKGQARPTDVSTRDKSDPALDASAQRNEVEKFLAIVGNKGGGRAREGKVRSSPGRREASRSLPRREERLYLGEGGEMSGIESSSPTC